MEGKQQTEDEKNKEKHTRVGRKYNKWQNGKEKTKDWKRNLEE